VVAGAVVYALDGVTLHALDASSGTELWDLDVGSSGGSPALFGGDLLVTGPTSLIAVDVSGGRGFVDWTFTEPDQTDGGRLFLEAAADDGTVLTVEPVDRLTEGSGALVALDAVSGEERWRVTDVDGEAVAVPVAVADGVAYAGGKEGSLWALDASTGEVTWTTDTGAEVTSAPAVAGGLVIVGNDDGDVVAFDAVAGVERWRFTTDDVVAAAPSVSGDTVIVSSYDGHTYGLDLATGEELWDIKTGRETDGAPSIVDGDVYLTAGQDVIAYGP
jgi:outer membrane protein assembly factor BamB